MVKHSINWIVSPHPLYKTAPKWHSFLMIKLAAFQANGAAYMKLRLPGNSEKIERRTSNAQHRTSNIDGFVKSLKTSFGVIPAKAGIQCFQIVLDACLRRHDGISDFLRVCHD